MPDPKSYDSEDSWMSACVPKMTDEGRGQEQAVAACLSMWRNKDAGGDDEQGERDDKEAPGLQPFMVWKEAGGSHRWLAVYSNKFRDDDHPPEILAEAAHKEFVDAVDAGEWPMPELWLWHVPGTRSGAADFVAYDDSGFALASGTFDADKEALAARLVGSDDLLTSHGMPISEIRRDTADKSIITRYRTREISPLPRWAAANKHGTGFTILTKGVDMGLPDKKRPFLADVMGEEAVADLEQRLADKAKELDAQEIEFKEAEAATPDSPKEAAPEATEAAAPDVAPPVEAPQPQYVTYGELEEVFAGYVKPMLDTMRGLVSQVEALGKELKEQQAEVKALQADDEEKLKQAMAQTPAASLFARVGSAIGADEALVDGRTTFAKSKPKEAAADAADGPTLVPFLNQLMAKQYGG